MLDIHPVEKPPAQPPEQLLVDVPTAAKMLAIGTRTLSRLTKDCKIVPIRIGRAVRYAVSDLQSFIALARGPVSVQASENKTGDGSEAIARPH